MHIREHWTEKKTVQSSRSRIGTLRTSPKRRARARRVELLLSLGKSVALGGSQHENRKVGETVTWAVDRVVEVPGMDCSTSIEAFYVTPVKIRLEIVNRLLP